MRTQGLSITLHGSPGTSEYQAAEWLRDLIRSAVLPTDIGTVAIYTDLYLSGFRREQIDILLSCAIPVRTQTQSPPSLRIGNHRYQFA